MRTKFPSIIAIARELRMVNLNVDSECDVRLQVYPDGQWAVRWGDASYDQDHRGYWGSSTVPGKRKRFASLETARDLIAQAKDHHADTEGE